MVLTVFPFQISTEKIENKYRGSRQKTRVKSLIRKKIVASIVL